MHTSSIRDEVGGIRVAHIIFNLSWMGEPLVSTNPSGPRGCSRKWVGHDPPLTSLEGLSQGPGSFKTDVPTMYMTDRLDYKVMDRVYCSGTDRGDP